MFCVFNTINTQESQLRSLALSQHFPDWSSNTTLLHGIRVFLILQTGRDPSAVTAIHGYCFLPFPIFVGQYISVSQKPPDCARSSPDHLQIVPSPLRSVHSKLNSTPGAPGNHTGSHLSLLLPAELLKGSVVLTHRTEKYAEHLELQLEKVNSPESKAGFTYNSKWIYN